MPIYMPRPLRIEFDGAWYHAINRGARRWKIFHEEKDYEIFFKHLGEIRELFNVEVHAYSLMDNHFHLLIHTPNSGLSRAMKHVCSNYAQFYNRKYKKDGPLFRGRFKSILVEKNEYLLALLRYIHTNPVKAYLCQKPEQHPYTSHVAYLNKKKRPQWLITNDILLEFGKTQQVAAKRLDDFVKTKEDPEFIKAIHSPRRINILGSEGFKDWIKYNFVDHIKRDVALPTQRSNKRKAKSPEQLLQIVISDFQINNRSDLFNIQRNNDALKIYIYLLRYLNGMSHSQIAKLVKMNTAGVSKALQRLGSNPDSMALIRAQALKKNLVSYVQV